jgi:hypothetical protein
MGVSSRLEQISSRDNTYAASDAMQVFNRASDLNRINVDESELTFLLLNRLLRIFSSLHNHR